MSHTCEATFGVPGRGRKGRGGARESRKRGVATDARGLPAFQVLDEIAPTARQVGVNHGAAQLDTVGDYLHYQWELWRLYGLGLHNTDDGQPHMAARLVRVLPEIAAWAATLPNDILLLEPWLMPLRADAAGAAGERALNH